MKEGIYHPIDKEPDKPFLFHQLWSQVHKSNIFFLHSVFQKTMYDAFRYKWNLVFVRRGGNIILFV